MTRGARPDDDAASVFRAAVADAMPLTSDRVHHEPPPAPPIPRHRERDEQAALAESIAAPDLADLHLEGGDEAAWLKPGMSPTVLRDLRRGRWVVQAHLDLHGMNRDEARHHVALFLAESAAHGQRCLRVVHGKGLGSPRREPVLKKLVLGWLAQRKEVLAFCQARPAEGGAGAVVVLIDALGRRGA
ncbi:MAG TPA: Smr/MutS family protein [Rhodocyclaceae bacterium]|nr:Smr/MutS family protein [Rhodocyclaceae bacterium]